MIENRKGATVNHTVEKRRMGNSELGNLLAAVGNHEGKALLLTAMKPNAVYTKAGLYSLMMSPQADKKVWQGMSRQLPFNWCRDSLTPIGLVAKEMVDTERGNVVGFGKTEKGESEGVSLAGHLLSFSEQHDISLISLLGSTVSSASSHTEDGAEAHKKRAPFRRVLIFEELVSRDLPIRQADLIISLASDYSTEFSSNNGVYASHLNNLAKSGIITYETIQESGSISFFQLADNSPITMPTQYHDEPTLTQDIYNIIRSHPGMQFDSETVAALYVKQYPSKTRNKMNILVDRTSKILNHLAQERYLIKGEFGKNERTKISLTGTQEETLVDFVNLIEKFTSMDASFLEEGKRQAQAIVSDTNRFSRLLQKAEDASPFANRPSAAETRDRIITILSTHPDSTVRTIQDLLQTQYGQEYTFPALSSVVKKLFVNSMITREKKGREYVYSAPLKEMTEEVILFG